MSKNYDGFAGLLADLATAKSEYEAAKMQASQASSRETTALNHLNEVQKKLDAAFGQIRKDMPYSSDWGSRGQASR